MSSPFNSFDDADELFEDLSDKRQSASLPDGDYEVEIVSAGPKYHEKSGDMFEFKLVVVGHEKYDGRKVDRTIFFDKKNGTDEEKEEYKAKKLQELKVDLKTLGFDVENWKKSTGRPFSQQLEAACTLMVGCKVKIRTKQNGEFANVYINKRLEDGKPAKFGAAEMAELTNTESGFDAAAKTPASGDPIPF